MTAEQSPPVAFADDPGGEPFAGRYQLMSVVGDDGIRRHLAEDIKLRRQVVVHRAPPGDPEVAARLRRDARVLDTLRLPVFPAVFDVGTVGGATFAVTEFVSGRALDDVIRDRRSVGFDSASRIIEPLADAFSAVTAADLDMAPLASGDVVVTDGGPRLVTAPLAAAGADESVHAAHLTHLFEELVGDCHPRASPPGTFATPAELVRWLRSLATAGDTTVDLPTTVLERPPPRARSLSLVARLTISYAVQLVAALCIVAALAVQLTRSHLERELDGRLRAIAESFEQGPARDVTSPEEVTAAARAWLAALPQPADQLVVVRTASGEVLSTASSLDLRTLPGGADLVAADVGKFWRLEGPGGDVRALSVPVTLDGQPAGTLVIAASTADITDRVSDLMRWILVAAGVGSAFAIAVAAVTVRRSLRPLSRMTDQVDAIQQAGDLGRRVTQDRRADEVGRLTAAFNGTLARLERAFSSQRQFVTDASHELRTPLTVARGQIELLREAIRQSTESNRSLVLVEDELDRMGRIVEDLLLLARLDEGLPLASLRVEVDLVVREALLRALPPTGVPVSVEIDPELCVLADPDRLLQVFTNLVVNAVHHGGDNVHLHICGRREAERVAIEVADDGPGIPGDELPLIFERFYRTAATRARASSGSGLGLAIVRSLVEQMGGGVVARSVPGEGTTLIVTLRPAP